MEGASSIADLAALPSRGVLRQQFVALLDHPVDHLMILSVVGPSGVGKSQVLTLLEAAVPAELLCLHSYDFFFVDNFKPTALEDAVIGAFEARRPGLKGRFETYYSRRDALSAARDSASGLISSQGSLRQAFVDAYNNVAEDERRAGRPLVLLFDSIEHAVELSDHAIQVLLGQHYREPHWGGEHWLLGILPLLTNTIVVCSGRTATSRSIPVTIAEDLATAAKTSLITLAVHPCPEAESLSLLRAHFAATGEAAPPDSDLLAWHGLAQGLPFWLAMLFTAHVAGTLPDVLAGFAAGPASEAERDAARLALMRATFLDEPPGGRSGLASLLAHMAWLRKGVTLELLTAINLPSEAAAGYDELQQLPIVRKHERTRPGRGDPYGKETLYFLHEEVYSLLDTLATPPLTLMDQVVAWYNSVHIVAQNNRRAQLSEVILDNDPNRVDPLLAQERDQLLIYRQLLDLDRLYYYFQLDPHQGLQSYNLVAYNAIVQRQYGHNLTVRQEGLRNLYRLYRDGLPLDIEAECAARWALRAAHIDPEKLLPVLERLAHYEALLPQLGPLQQAFLRLAKAQALLLRNLTLPGNAVARLLAQAEAAVSGVSIDLKRSPWDNLLLAQIAHWQGVYHSQGFSYQLASTYFRQSYVLAKRWPLLSRGLQAQTLSELALAYAEQGDSDDGRLFGERALQVELRLGSVYHIARTFALLSRIEVRGGRHGKALDYALRGHNLMAQIENPDGRIETMLVLGEAYRKAAEDLDYDRFRQAQFFELALTICDELSGLFASSVERHGPASGALRCEIEHLRGVSLRSRGLVRSRRYPSLLPDQAATDDFEQARRALSLALQIAIRHKLPGLVQIDIAEDLAAVTVHEERFDQQLVAELDAAESYALEEYRIKEERGLPRLANPIHGYWRELGQCQLQRMMLAFGTFERGFTGPVGSIPPLSIESLRQAGVHMMLMFGYLLGYARSSWMLQRAEQLMLRELDRLIDLAEDPAMFDDWLDEIVESAYEAGQLYRLGPEAQARLETLVKKIRRDREFRSAS